MEPRTGRHERARTRLDPTVRRASILDAAELVFDGRNPAEVTFEEIAVAASVARGLVYNYFGDKGGLVAALYRRTFDRLDQAILERLDGHDTDGEAALRAVVGAYLCFARDHQSAWRLISTAEAAAHPEVQSARQERFRRMAAAWGGLDHALVLAAGIVGFLEASTLAWLDKPRLPIDAATDLMVRMIWGGVANLDGTTGLRLPPHTTFDSSTFVPRAAALADAP